MVCKESVRPSPPRIIILITAVTTCPPAPLPFFSVLFFLRCKFATFFFFFGLVWFYLEEGAAWELLFVFSRGDLLACFLTFKLRFLLPAPPLCPSFLLVSVHSRFWFVVGFFFFLCTSNREEVFFCNAFGGVGSDLGGWRS